MPQPTIKLFLKQTVASRSIRASRSAAGSAVPIAAYRRRLAEHLGSAAASGPVSHSPPTAGSRSESTASPWWRVRTVDQSRYASPSTESISCSSWLLGSPSSVIISDACLAIVRAVPARPGRGGSWRACCGVPHRTARRRSPDEVDGPLLRTRRWIRPSLPAGQEDRVADRLVVPFDPFGVDGALGYPLQVTNVTRNV